MGQLSMLNREHRAFLILWQLDESLVRLFKPPHPKLEVFQKSAVDGHQIRDEPTNQAAQTQPKTNQCQNQRCDSSYRGRRKQTRQPVATTDQTQPKRNGAQPGKKDKWFICEKNPGQGDG